MTLTLSPADRLLAWYDTHHRDLPWRTGPADRRAGIWPDPYNVWLSEIMLQQTTVAAVTGYFQRFVTRWPSVQALAAAPSEDVMSAWAGLGYYSRARNLHACARLVAAQGGFPTREVDLIKLPGIGPYTAAAIASIAFDRKAVVMDGNVERVMARRFTVTDPLPGSKPLLKRHAADLTPDERAGDYAQAVMDLGATICTPRRPACGICPWVDDCDSRRQGIAATLPRKTPKKPKKIRSGIVYAGFAGKHVLVVRRPDKGLLGGMLALPTTEWATTPPEPAPPMAADWTDIGEVRHTFTHFHLRLRVAVTRFNSVSKTMIPADDAAEAFPTVFKKALFLAINDGSSRNAAHKPPQS
ncbi:MAG: A/G-specific adenine glycosylase [Pseudomonadota bacterium]